MSESNLNVGTMLKKIVLEQDKHIDNWLVKFNLSHSQIRVLGYVLRSDEKGIAVNQRMIEGALHLSNPTVSGIVTRLEEKHYINRRASSEDARVKYVFPTGTSKMLKNTLLDFFDAEKNRLTKNFTDEEQATLEALILKIAANVGLEAPEKTETTK